MFGPLLVVVHSSKVHVEVQILFIILILYPIEMLNSVFLAILNIVNSNL